MYLHDKITFFFFKFQSMYEVTEPYTVDNIVL